MSVAQAPVEQLSPIRLHTRLAQQYLSEKRFELALLRFANLYRGEGREDDAKEQVNLYLKYKQMKDKMEKTFHDMRVISPSRPSDDEGEKKN